MHVGKPLPPSWVLGLYFFIPWQVLVHGLALRAPQHSWFYSHITLVTWCPPCLVLMCTCIRLWRKEVTKIKNKEKYNRAVCLHFLEHPLPEQLHSAPFYCEDAFSVHSSPWSPVQKAQNTRKAEHRAQSSGAGVHEPDITFSFSPRCQEHPSYFEKQSWNSSIPCPINTVNTVWRYFLFSMMYHVSR